MFYSKRATLQKTVEETESAFSLIDEVLEATREKTALALIDEVCRLTEARLNERAEHKRKKRLSRQEQKQASRMAREWKKLVAEEEKIEKERRKCFEREARVKMWSLKYRNTGPIMYSGGGSTVASPPVCKYCSRRHW